MRRFVLVLLLATGSAQHSAQASQPPNLNPVLLSFAVCAGRYAAFAQSTWTAPGQQADSRSDLDSFLELLEAAGPPTTDQGRAASALRMARAKARNATQRLLSIQRLAQDQRRARLAQATLIQQRSVCADLIR